MHVLRHFSIFWKALEGLNELKHKGFFVSVVIVVWVGEVTLGSSRSLELKVVVVVVVLAIPNNKSLVLVEV